MRLALSAAALLALAGCHCDFETRGACVVVDAKPSADFPYPLGDRAALRLRFDIALAEADRILQRSVSLDGWTIVVSPDRYPCATLREADGCTTPSIQLIQVRAQEWCPERWVPHEVGHVAGLDRGHLDPRWTELDHGADVLYQCGSLLKP